MPTDKSIAAAIAAAQGTDSTPGVIVQPPPATIVQPPPSDAAPKEEPPKADAAPKEEPPKVDDKAEAAKEAETVTKGWTVEAKDAYRDLRAEHRAARRELAALKEQIAKQPQGATPEQAADLEKFKSDLSAKDSEIAALKAKAEKYEQEVSVRAVEATPDFEKFVIEPRQKIGADAQALAEAYKLNERAVLAAFNETDVAARNEAISKLTADMGEYDRHRFYRLVDSFHETVRAESDLRSRAKEIVDRTATERRQREEQSAQEEKAAWEKALPVEWDRLLEEAPVIAPIPGDKESAEFVEKVKAFATPDRWGKLTPGERATALYRAGAFPGVIDALEAKVKEVAALKAEIAKYESASPAIGGGGGTAPAPTSGGEQDSIKAALGKLRAAGVTR